VILRVDEMAELPTDAVNPRCRPVADSRECQLPVASSLKPLRLATLPFALPRPAHAVCGACASVPYLVTGRLSSVRQLIGSGLDSGPTT
jgi:hypothetical protein